MNEKPTTCRIGVLILFASFLLGCTEPVSPTFEQEWIPESENNRENFRFVSVGAVPNAKMTEVAEKLDQHFDRLLVRQGVTEMPRITVKVWGDRSAFETAFLKHQEGNAKLVGGYVDADNWEARFFNFNRPIGLTAVHEVTHLVSLAANPTIANNPRWLWEAVAIYESNRPPVPKREDLRCFGKGTGPSLQRLNEHSLDIYRVGYYLAEYVVETWGIDALRSLVERNGDVKGVLGIPVQQFEISWHGWMGNVESDLGESGSDC